MYTRVWHPTVRQQAIIDLFLSNKNIQLASRHIKAVLNSIYKDSNITSQEISSLYKIGFLGIRYEDDPIRFTLVDNDNMVQGYRKLDVPFYFLNTRFMDYIENKQTIKDKIYYDIQLTHKLVVNDKEFSATKIDDDDDEVFED